MKNSGVEWIGEIPDEWELKRGKELFFEINDRCKNPENYPLLSVSEYYGVAPKSEKIDEGDFITHAETLDGYKICQKGDIVQNIMLAWKRATGMSNYEGLISPAYCIYRPYKGIDSKYYHYLFRTDVYADLFKQYSTGIIDSRLRLYPAKFLSLKYAYPPKETQQRIATYLDKKCSKIEETIQKQQQVIEKLKAYKQSLITEAVTGKVKIVNGKACGEYESYKDSGVEWIGRIPSGWEIKKLKYIADSFSKGSGITKEEIVINGDTPCVRYGELYTKYDYHFTECQTRTNLGIIETPKYFSHGDVLFTCTGELVEEIGKSIAYLGNEKCLAGGDIIVLKHSQDPMFMGFALDSKYVQGQKSFGKTKLKVVHISSEEIARLLIVLPSKEEQKEIADYLDKKYNAIDTAIEQKQNLIEKLTEYKKSLIYECVTGKKEV